MGWQSEQFGAAHEGIAGAVLADGSEPKPAYFDLGSGASMQKTSEWWAYNGQLGHPRASHLRASCTCGWRGDNLYPIDWNVVGEDADTTSAHTDWQRHISDIDAGTLPLPADVADLLQQLDVRLAALADDAPLAAIKAVTALQRSTASVGCAAATQVQMDADAGDTSWARIATALGLNESEARSCVRGLLFRH